MTSTVATDWLTISGNVSGEMKVKLIVLVAEPPHWLAALVRVSAQEPAAISRAEGV